MIRLCLFWDGMIAEGGERLHSPSQLLDTSHQDMAGWLFQPNTVKLGHRPGSSEVASRSSTGKAIWGLEPGGTTSSLHTLGQGAQSSHL